MKTKIQSSQLTAEDWTLAGEHDLICHNVHVGEDVALLVEYMKQATRLVVPDAEAQEEYLAGFAAAGVRAAREYASVGLDAATVARAARFEQWGYLIMVQSRAGLLADRGLPTEDFDAIDPHAVQDPDAKEPEGDPRPRAAARWLVRMERKRIAKTVQAHGGLDAPTVALKQLVRVIIRSDEVEAFNKGFRESWRVGHEETGNAYGARLEQIGYLYEAWGYRAGKDTTGVDLEELLDLDLSA